MNESQSPRPVRGPEMTRTGVEPPPAPPRKNSIALPCGPVTAASTSFPVSTAKMPGHGVKPPPSVIVRTGGTAYRSPGLPLAPGGSTEITGSPSPPTTYSYPCTSTTMARLSGPSALKIRTGPAAPWAPGANTNEVASDRNVCTYRCPERSKVMPQGSHTVAGFRGLATVCTGATVPWLDALYAVTGPASALAT